MMEKRGKRSEHGRMENKNEKITHHYQASTLDIGVLFLVEFGEEFCFQKEISKSASFFSLNFTPNPPLICDLSIVFVPFSRMC
jgi:hypothetical protein